MKYIVNRLKVGILIVVLLSPIYMIEKCHAQDSTAVSNKIYKIGLLGFNPVDVAKYDGEIKFENGKMNIKDNKTGKSEEYEVLKEANGLLYISNGFENFRVVVSDMSNTIKGFRYTKTFYMKEPYNLTYFCVEKN